MSKNNKPYNNKVLPMKNRKRTPDLDKLPMALKGKNPNKDFDLKDFINGDSRLLNKFENPLQVLVDDTNEILTKYHGTMFDAMEDSFRSDLSDLADKWVEEKLVTSEFTKEDYINHTIDLVRYKIRKGD